jgi:cytoskeletal protein CcmA (bactofilin family)|tara:strand:- start:248 stop:703 length:456 start_codon:yes stop_codon:yes gene_type:complete
MFSKDQSNQDSKIYDVLEKTKGSANVVIGNGVIIKGEILQADTVQIDGTADVTMTTENLMIGVNGHLKGDLTSHHVEVWGKLDGNIKVTGTLTVQEAGMVSGNLEYENLQVKLGGQITGDVNVSKKASAKKPINTPKDDVDGYDNDPKPGD